MFNSAEDVVVQFIQQSESKRKEDIRFKDINSSQAFLADHNLVEYIFY